MTIQSWRWATAAVAGSLLLVGCSPSSSGETSTTEMATTATASTTSSSSTTLAAPSDEGLQEELDLHRVPMSLQYIDAGEECPVTPVADELSGVVAQTYGAGPVYATLGSWDGTVQTLDALVSNGWFISKVLWSVDPMYTGPVLIRGRQLDGGGALLFAADDPSPYRQLVELSLPAGEPTRDQAARFIASGITYAQPGCYGVQVDGVGFSDSIVFLVTDG
jgi:hypothetical protein